MVVTAVKWFYDLADTQADIRLETILDSRCEDDKIVIIRVSISVLQWVGYLRENANWVRMYTRTVLRTHLLSIRVIATQCVVSLDTWSKETIYSRATRKWVQRCVWTVLYEGVDGWKVGQSGRCGWLVIKH